MENNRLSFIEMLEKGILIKDESVRIGKIVIPMIQRDYAQGRLDKSTERVRNRFLSALYNAIDKEEPITLDFVYGDIIKDGKMTPLDGQQRLTTLFLLHWYAAKKENIPAEEGSFLKKFSYETRYSAREFCEELEKFKPSFLRNISEEIEDQAWFPLDWKKDPTISGMLVMLDAIHNKFRSVQKIWKRLKDDKAITFDVLLIKEMALTDEIYIRMNSRGKSLTEFEHFKAELERNIKEVDGDDRAAEIIRKIDTARTDLLWEYSKSDEKNRIVDDRFLKYFRFICNVICCKEGKATKVNDNADALELLQKYFQVNENGHNKEKVKSNLKEFEAFFDCWLKIEGYYYPNKFLQDFMINKFGENQKDDHSKIVNIFNNDTKDIFDDCQKSCFGEQDDKKYQKFSFGRTVLLYAITVYLRNQDKVSMDDFRRRIRIVNNLIQNSKNEIKESKKRSPKVFGAVDEIILKGGDIIREGKIGDIKNSFNQHQIEEEEEKFKFLKANHSRAKEVFELENHSLLRGQIGIIGLKNLHLGRKFVLLFHKKCNYDKVDCALMTIGNYAQEITRKDGIYYQFGTYGKEATEAWRALFHKSDANDAKKDFDKTKAILKELLESYEDFSEEVLDKIRDAFIQKCEKESKFPFEYYYVKYDVFRPGKNGLSVNGDAENEPYLFFILTASKRSLGMYMPYLEVIWRDESVEEYCGEPDYFSDDAGNYGALFGYDKVCIACKNDGYSICKYEKDSDEKGRELYTLPIPQVHDSKRQEKVDSKDRIKLLTNYILENVKDGVWHGPALRGRR